ncbi:hypothetical protein KM043_013106 [Ampulex compressa]|nr:hypothetical protein KM043_013106 [Ampulex compressa]
MKYLILVAGLLAFASAAPERERRSLGWGHNGAVVLGGLAHGLAVAPSAAVVGPVAPAVSVVGPAAGSAAVVGPSAGSAAVVGPSAGHAAVIGPAAASTVVAGPAGAVVAPGIAVGHGHGLLGLHGIW